MQVSVVVRYGGMKVKGLCCADKEYPEVAVLAYLQTAGRGTGNASPPKLFTDPVADSLLILAFFPTNDVTRNLLFIDDASRGHIFIFHDAFPMAHELTTVFGWVSRHGNGFGFKLLLEENGEVGFGSGA